MPLGSRGSVVTTSGLPHGHRWPIESMPRGRRSSWARIAASSAASMRGLSRGSRLVAHCLVPSTRSTGSSSGGGGLPASSIDSHADVHQAVGTVLITSSGSLSEACASSGSPSASDHLEAGLAGHQVAEPCAGLRLDVGRVVPALLLPLEVVDAGLALGDLRLEVADVGPLLEVGPQRRRVGHGQHREHQHQHRGTAGEAGTTRGAARGGRTRRRGDRLSGARGRRTRPGCPRP